MMTALFVLILAVVLYYVFHLRSPSRITSNLGSGAMFDKIAPYYDTANKFMSLGFDQSWRKRLVDEMGISSGEVLLDLACGTGDVAILIAKHVENNQLDGNRVLCVDPSTNMLEFAENKVRKLQLYDHVSVQVGDAENLEHIFDNSVNKVSMSFGIRNVMNKTAALDEIFRILKLNGQLFIMEFVPPSNEGFLGKAANIFVRYVVPFLGSIISMGHSEEYKHLERSIFEFPRPSGFIDMIQHAGFSDCKAIDIFADVVYIFEARKPA
jgi:demethylmenaquinone methyltransferase / 2-methoxy-6-polyprenyl-1,4-benzoquinol methylase